MSGVFQVYEDRAGRWRFRLKAGNGQVVAVSDPECPYGTKAAAKKGTQSVQVAADGAVIVDLDDPGAAS